MRFNILAVLVLALLVGGCRWLPFTSKSKPSPADQTAPAMKAAPSDDFGGYPNDFQQRIVSAFQAKWPNDPIYVYRFELPRRVEISHSNKKGYAVRFRAQKPSISAPLPDGYPWVAFFEYGKIVWVQRDSEAGNTVKWYDGPQEPVDWAPNTPAR